ncbi:HlyD family secretion protein [Thalassotalea piscium]|uniref:Multidrug resistance efflux pump n=1 Tax=Thalassotalea piscium TaxID=1230533 RepID=A0A7X0NIV2_9GAMM|nr:efflux RND transporter periplasmic adaptor subunit [Thalassotalea piscium]MBB6544220.1 multidrug resistance efflux pump [Thalassotalea piscium]
MYRVITFFLLSLFFTQVLAQNVLILSGEIKAGDNQTFYSPKTDNWRVQLQWLLPEGEIANKGDLVVVFDSGAIQSTIEQTDVNLYAAKEELARKKSDAKQQLMEKEFAQKRTELLLAKARIDASIPVEHLSQYDYEKYQLDLEKALLANAKAKDELAQQKVVNEVNITKQELTIKKYEFDLDYNQNKLSKMSLYAERTGPILYANHPWTGEKIFVGMTAQPAWKIAEIPSMKGLYIEAWVHEVDYKKVAVGDSAKLTFDAYPNQVFTATIKTLSTQPEERMLWGDGVYYRTVVDFTVDVNTGLLPGMSAQLEFQGVSNE